MSTISEFMERHFKHFNARETLQAAKAYKEHLGKGGKMMLAIAGAMSTAEMGSIIGKMICEDKIHAISCTGANLEEDIYNLVGRKDYKELPDYLQLNAKKEAALREQEFNRVTDTAIPEHVFLSVEKPFFELCKKASKKGESYFPHEYFYQIFESKALESHYQISTENSWVMAAWKKNIPIFVPGWEDSSLGNTFVGKIIKKELSYDAVKTGHQYMEHLVGWYQEQQKDSSLGFFQIGGGIAGDFSICVVPMLIQDLKKNIKKWGYFAQISDSVTSYGSYSGAVPNEKITWLKLSPDTPSFMINSDATVIAPLIFAYILGM